MVLYEITRTRTFPAKATVMTKRQHLSIFTVLWGVVVLIMTGAFVVPLILMDRAARTERALSAAVAERRRDNTVILQKLKSIQAGHPKRPEIK